jgi:hypothetical protein
MRELLLKNLSLSIEPKVVVALVGSYEKLQAKFKKGDLDGCLAEAGKFVEHTLRAVEHIRTGVAPAEIKSAHQTVKEIEKDSRLPESLRILMPRIAHAMIYDIRSKRGGMHVKEIDPRQIDAALAAQAASWVMAEFVRLYHDGAEQAIARAMLDLMTGHVPFIEQFGDESVVTRKVPCNIELLLLLTRAGSEGLDRGALGKSSNFSPPTVTRTVQRMDELRQVHRSRGGKIHITSTGERELSAYLIEADGHSG